MRSSIWEKKESVDREIDSFVNRLNLIAKDLDDDEDVPEPFHDGLPDEYGFHRWKVIKRDCSKWIGPLISSLPKRFPESYYSFISRYSFPCFEVGELFLFGNTGTSYAWELKVKMFIDEHMDPILLKNGYLQIGNPQKYDYDPVCFDTKQADKTGREYPLMQLDHEAILCHSKIVIIKKIADSFLEWTKRVK